MDKMKNKFKTYETIEQKLNKAYHVGTRDDFIGLATNFVIQTIGLNPDYLTVLVKAYDLGTYRKPTVKKLNEYSLTELTEAGYEKIKTEDEHVKFSNNKYILKMKEYGDKYKLLCGTNLKK